MPTLKIELGPAKMKSMRFPTPYNRVTIQKAKGTITFEDARGNLVEELKETDEIRFNELQRKGVCRVMSSEGEEVTFFYGINEETRLAPRIIQIQGVDSQINAIPVTVGMIYKDAYYGDRSRTLFSPDGVHLGTIGFAFPYTLLLDGSEQEIDWGPDINANPIRASQGGPDFKTAVICVPQAVGALANSIEVYGGNGLIADIPIQFIYNQDDVVGNTIPGPGIYRFNITGLDRLRLVGKASDTTKTVPVVLSCGNVGAHT